MKQHQFNSNPNLFNCPYMDELKSNIDINIPTVTYYLIISKVGSIIFPLSDIILNNFFKKND